MQSDDHFLASIFIHIVPDTVLEHDPSDFGSVVKDRSVFTFNNFIVQSLLRKERTQGADIFTEGDIH